jgi:acetyltransferase
MAFDQEKARQLIAGAPDQGFRVGIGFQGNPRSLWPARDQDANRHDRGTSRADRREMGYPVVMKLHSPDITHKTDADGVRLDLRGDADVGQAYRQILSSARHYNPMPASRG